MTSNKNCLVLIFSILFASNLTYSQVFDSGLQFVDDIRIKNRVTDISDIDGSPYINEIFAQALITPINKVFMVRYDAVSDHMEVSKDGNEILIIDKKVKDYSILFVNEDKKYVILSDNNQMGYFIEIKKLDNVSLYKKEEKTYHEKEAANSSYQKAKPAYFSNLKILYYLKLSEDNSELLELSSSKSSLFKLFPKHKNDLKTYIKKEKINLKEEKDIIKITEYINQLL